MRPGGIILGLLAVYMGVFGYFSLTTAQAKTRVEVNIFYPGAAWNVSSLNSFEKSLGVNFTSAKWYMDWDTTFDTTAAKNLHNAGYLPELTWQPQDGGVGVSYNKVSNGDYDAYITQTANLVKSLSFPIRISLAPEMNATWTPWGGLSGNNPGNFKTFWQHVVGVFNATGADNVTWIWSPNVNPFGAEKVGTFQEMYPGNSYVDYMGLDGYNWGKSQSWSTWQSFREVFEGSYNELVKVSSKNILIMEVSSAEVGGSKAGWITDMFNQLDNSFSRIKGFTWFHINKETDWRITSSASAKQAFIDGYLNIDTASQSTNTANSSPSSATTQPKNQSASGSIKTPNTSKPKNETANNQQPITIRPKIAGTTFIEDSAPAMDLADKMGILTSMFLGGTMAAGLFIRRFKRIHLTHFSAVPKFGHKIVDGVLHPQSHHQHIIKRSHNTLR